MYKQYWNDYEKRADQIRKAAHAVEQGTAPLAGGKPPFDAKNNVQEGRKCETVVMHEEKEKIGILGHFSKDDILLLALLFILISSEKKDTTLIIILGYLFLSGL